MKKKNIFLASFIALLTVMSFAICSVYRNDQIQELGRSGKQAVTWYLENQIQETVRGMAQSVRPNDEIVKFDSGLPDYMKSMITNDLKENFAKSYLELKKDSNFQYYIKDLKSGKEYGDKRLRDMSQEELRTSSLLYGLIEYDKEGNPKIFGDFDDLDFQTQSLTQYLHYFDVTQEKGNIVTYQVNDEKFTQSQVVIQNPRQMKIMFRIPEKVVKDQGVIARTVYDWTNYTQFSVIAALIGTLLLILYLLFYPISIVEEVNPFLTFKKVKFGILFILLATGITMGTAGVLALSGATISGTLLSVLNEYHIMMPQQLLFLANLVCWMLYFLMVSIALFEIKYIFVKGFWRFLREDTLVGSMVSGIHRHIDSLADIDLKDDATRCLLKFMLLQIAIMIVLCLFWWFGMFLAILYGFALFMWLKQKLNSIQSDYEILLKQSQELKEGNFQTELPADVGIFNALKDEFSEIRTGFEKAVQEETKSQNMKTELISNVSHDLKTPLTGIRNYVELLQQEGISEEQRKEYVSMLDQYARRLHILMEDLFEVSKANSGNIQLDMVELDIIALVEQVQAECSELLQERQLEVVWNRHDLKQVSVMLDGNKAFRIFENLFINIHHYALAHTRVYIDIRQVKNQVRIECKNISKEPLNFDADDIVDRFVRGDKSRHDGGSGLGLAIAKSFTEAMKGSFCIETDGDLFKAIVEFPLIKDA
ncbi:sensor histidine kinase [Erysipelotrichaceae bacterium AF15-26LB]|nr:HAMP domain-containing histidine kinase [[Clostridium] innocuum]RJV90072.1 sensor histidine kinase [Erysipelotrichaceae bacterium AF15-26LB]RJV93303.1 sensor histidine kinase [Erysipelotrichaceae bacterium AF19-24AC]